jgi:5-methylcytosine-specific restriction enzyme B
MDDSTLAALVNQFRIERPYTKEHQREASAYREKFAEYLTRDAVQNLDVPMVLHILSSSHYGYPGHGPRTWIPRYLKESGQAGKQRLQATVEHLLYGDGQLSQRLDTVLNANGPFKVKGLGPSGAMKLLAVCYPDKIVPVYPLFSENAMGKADLLGILGIDFTPWLDASIGKQIVESNERIRSRLEPYFPGDLWGMGQFFYWPSSGRKLTELAKP